MAEDKPAGDKPAGDKPAGPGDKAGGADPSMEDILASIRRILNEDEDATPGWSGAPTRPGSAATDAGEPLELTEDMLIQGLPAEPAAPAEPEPPAPVVLPPAEAPSRTLTPPPAAAAPPEAAGAAAPSRDALVAPAVMAAASASVGQLLRAVASERGAGITRAGPTIEDVVREELRPLLKAWLDAHLPATVERLVRAEIERVVGRALS